jgi:Geminivirus Rep catalytic domain.
MNPFIEPGVSVYHNTKAKIYPNGQQRITVCSKPIFKDEYWEQIDKPLPMPKPKNMENDVRGDSVKRAKERIFDVAMCNQFDYFVTWTLDADKINRYDAKQISTKLKKFLNNKVTRNNARYLVIPEHHKDGAIHMHGLLSGDFEMVDSGKKTKDGKIIYNMPQWSLGFSTAIQLDEQKERVSRYITKYVTKDFKKIFGSFYYAGGHGLVRHPKTQIYDVDYDSLDLQEYSPEAVNLWFKYINTDDEGEC